MAEELKEVLEIGTISLEPGIPFYYEVWGIRYRFKSGDWRIADISFRKKSDAENWMKAKYLKYEGMDGEVVPVKQTVVLEESGNIKSWTEELS